MPSHQFEDRNQVTDNQKIKVWKRWLEADHVLKFDNKYLFAETIKDIEFEEIKLEEQTS